MARRRPTPLRRPRYRREPKRQFIIFCEGANTEPQYFRALRQTISNSLIDIKTIGGVGVPFTIANAAAKHAQALGLSPKSRKALNSFEERDEVWAVFDRDEHHRFDEAVQICESKGVGVGRSNPCFEVWLILHEAEYDRPDDRHAAQNRLHQLRPEYDTNARKTPNCDELVTRVEIAEERARIQLERRFNEGSPFGAPSTTVGKLTSRIRLSAGLIK